MNPDISNKLKRPTNTRRVVEQSMARPAADGDGVKLERVFGGTKPERYDPFLLLDEFGSEDADDYIGGFPSHPHRGFSTITYMLQGMMEHRDNMENVGLLKDGDVQWMTAGKGIIHSEMPQQTEGKMRGFQLWLNLPAKEKLQAAHYKDVAANQIPQFNMEGVSIKAIAGKSMVNNIEVDGYFQVEHTDPVYLDIQLDGATEVRIDVLGRQTALVYDYEGEVLLGEQRKLSIKNTLSRLDNEGDILIKNQSQKPARILVLAGVPLKETIVQYGPFVMNSTLEIEQALADYRNGTLTD